MRSRAAPGPRHKHGEGGAVAILTAIIAVVLFGFAAVAVELGDMFSRDAAVQTTADLAAFAGAQDLPNTCDAFDGALASLNSTGNGVLSDTEPSGFAATAADMSDGDPANGEIEILDRNNNPVVVVPPCNETELGRRVTVTTPTRTVKFPFASTLPGAPSSGTVQASATVELRGLELDVLPFSVPDGCPKGGEVIHATNSGSPSSTPDYRPDGNDSGPYVTDVDPDSTQLPAPATIAVGLSRLRRDPSLPNPGIQFDFHLLQPDGTTLRAPLTGAIDGTWDPSFPVVTTTVSGSTQYAATFTVPLPASVQTTPGLWHVRGIRTRLDGSKRYSRDSQVGMFTVEAPTPSDCTPPENGTFGLLASPRAGGGSSATAMNFILGIDHDLFPVASPLTDIPCVSNENPYPDGRLDVAPATDGATCVDLRQTTSATTAGLVDGAGGQDGRLVVTPTFTPPDDCVFADDPDLEWTKNGEQLVDTVLSCYLTPTSTLANVADGDEGSLTREILSDPRFFVIPTTDTSVHPPNRSGAPFRPIKSFRGAFLTNETAGGDATCASNESDNCNGLTFNDSDQLTRVQAFTFPLSALPDLQEQEPGNGRAYIGGPQDLLLVE